jgi:hypothetical protein
MSFAGKAGAYHSGVRYSARFKGMFSHTSASVCNFSTTNTLAYFVRSSVTKKKVYKGSFTLAIIVGETVFNSDSGFVLGDSGICLGINYSVSNETKRDE